MDIEVSSHHLLSGLIQRVARTTAQGTDDIAVVLVRAQLGADRQDGGKKRGLEQRAPMMIDTVFQTSLAASIRPGLSFEHDRIAVRQKQPRPDQKNT